MGRTGRQARMQIEPAVSAAGALTQLGLAIDRDQDRGTGEVLGDAAGDDADHPWVPIVGGQDGSGDWAHSGRPAICSRASLKIRCSTVRRFLFSSSR